MRDSSSGGWGSLIESHLLSGVVFTIGYSFRFVQSTVGGTHLQVFDRMSRPGDRVARRHYMRCCLHETTLYSPMPFHKGGDDAKN